MSLFMLFSMYLVSPSIAAPIVSPTQDIMPMADAPLTLDAVVERAIEQNRRLSAAIRDLHSARLGVHAASALTNPQIAFTPALTGGVGGGSDNELFLSQPLEWNGARSARKAEAMARLRQTEAETGSMVREVIYRVRTAYLELVRSREQATFSRDVLKIAEELDRLAKRQVELGARPAIEGVQTGIEMIKARQQVTLAEAGVTVHEAALNALLNRTASTPIGEVTLPTEPVVLPSNEEAERLALLQRTELTAGSASAEVFRQQARSARAEGIPDVAPQFRATSITRSVQQSGFGIGITLPLFDHGNRRRRIQQAEESAKAEEERIAALTASIRSEVTQAIVQLRAAVAVAETYPDNLLPEAKRLQHASRIGYEEGKTTILTLLDAQRTYRQAQSDHINAQVNVALARYELERAIGLLPANVKAAFERRLTQ